MFVSFFRYPFEPRCRLGIVLEQSKRRSQFLPSQITGIAFFPFFRLFGLVRIIQVFPNFMPPKKCL